MPSYSIPMTVSLGSRIVTKPTPSICGYSIDIGMFSSFGMFDFVGLGKKGPAIHTCNSAGSTNSDVDASELVQVYGTCIAFLFRLFSTWMSVHFNRHDRNWNPKFVSERLHTYIVIVIMPC